VPEDTGGEKTLPASQHKKMQQREKGNVAKSTDLSAAVTLLAALGGLYLLGPAMFEGMREGAHYYFSQAWVLLPEASDMQPLALGVVLRIAYTVLPLMLVLLLAGILINVAQIGLLFAPQVLQPKPGKLNPISGFKKFASLRTLVEFIKSVLKLAVIGTVVYYTLRNRWDEVLLFPYLPPAAMAGAMAKLIALVWLRAALAMIILGLLDLAFQRWQHERDLRMTQQEVRDELKQFEGDPRIRQRVRAIQRQMAMQRMMREVPTADVVITNPVTYAVALRYDVENMDAPTVVAKGARLLAERIRNAAMEHDVPIVEKPELARELYRTLELGHTVPEKLFRAVAEILAFVYGIDRREEKRRERAQVMTPRQAVG
jgi:flagellar biosynthesis protein FlhB